MSKEHAPMSKPQKALYEEIRDTVSSWGQPGLFVRSGSIYDRTVRALLNRGLIVCDERDYSNNRMHHYVVAPVAAPVSEETPQ